MKNKIYIVLVLLLFSCNDYDYKISNLKNEKIKFDDLPQVVRSFYLNPDGFGKNEKKITDLVCLDQNCKYEIKTVKTFFGPWVAYDKLIDLEREVSYHIEQGKPYPYLIYNNKLYITNKFNIFSTVQDYSTLEITCYSLMDK